MSSNNSIIEVIMIRAVIFDLDGLLIDSEGLWQKTDIEFLQKRGVVYNKRTRNKIRGTGQREAIEIYKKEFMIEGDIKNLISERRGIFYSLVKGKLSLLPGAEKFIKELHSKGYLLAVATGGHTKERIEGILRQFGLNRYFSLLVSSDEVERGKPAPDVYFATAIRLGVKPLNCLVLEDAVNGVLAAKNAGMKVFGINKDLQIRTKLKEAGADKIFLSLEEIISHLTIKRGRKLLLNI